VTLRWQDQNSFLEDKLSYDAFYAALGKMNAKNFFVVYLIYVYGHDYQSISEIFSLSCETIRKYHERSLKMMREELEKEIGLNSD